MTSKLFFRSIKSQSTSLLEQGGQIVLLGLQIAVATNVLLVDKDVGDGALARQLGQGLLDLGAVGLVVQLDGVELGVEAAEQRLGGLAVRAVGLGEDGCREGELVSNGTQETERGEKGRQCN
jgi:hypothetical protein